MNKMYRSIWNAVSETHVAVGETSKANRQRCATATLAVSAMAVALAGVPGTAQAALVSVCTGVSLPPSTITTMLNPLVAPLAGALPLLGLNTVWTGIAAGAPIRLNVLDTAGTPVLSTAVCDAIADSYALNTPKGISIGGNKITGLGITTVANAGETGSIALGNGAATNAAAVNSMAFGTNASVGAAGTNSVALGAGSTANTGAQVAYAAFGLAAPRTSAGEVSVGSAGSLRKITNVAPGSALTDAVNVEQLQAVTSTVSGAVMYDNPALKTTVTLGAPLSTDGGFTNGTTITNVHQGALSLTSTDAINGAQLFATNQSILNIIRGDSIAYFHANSLKPDSQANAADSISIGPNAVANGVSSVAMGLSSRATSVGGVAIGANSVADRAGMNGATEKYSNVAVTSTQGAVSVGSPGNERQITNVAGGTAPTDAVNLRQLDAAVGQLNQGIANVQRDANAGTAAAMATASLPQASLPGRSMVVAGIATYQGQSALAVGVSSLSENGRWVIKFNGGTTTRGNAGAGVGVGFHF